MSRYTSSEEMEIGKNNMNLEKYGAKCGIDTMAQVLPLPGRSLEIPYQHAATSDSRCKEGARVRGTIFQFYSCKHNGLSISL